MLGTSQGKRGAKVLTATELVTMKMDSQRVPLPCLSDPAEPLQL